MMEMEMKIIKMNKIIMLINNKTKKIKKKINHKCMNKVQKDKLLMTKTNRLKLMIRF